MKKIISLEYAKLKKFHVLKILFGAYILMVPTWMLFMNWFLNKNPVLKPIFTQKNLFEFPQLWSFTTYCASFFNILLCVIVVIITCNEIQYKTMRQNIIDGMTKMQVIFGKFFVVLMFSIAATLITFLSGLLIGGFSKGFDHCFENIHLVVLYFLQTLGYFSFAFLFALIVKRPAIAIISFILYFPVESIFGALVTLKLKYFYQFFPLKVYADLTPIPFFQSVLAADKNNDSGTWVMPMNYVIMFAIIYVLFFFGLTYWILKRRDL